MIHVFLQSRQSTSIDVAISNIFKEKKKVGSVFQLPMELEDQKVCALISLFLFFFLSFFLCMCVCVSLFPSLCSFLPDLSHAVLFYTPF